jgi:hypothetical protein
LVYTAKPGLRFHEYRFQIALKSTALLRRRTKHEAALDRRVAVPGRHPAHRDPAPVAARLKAAMRDDETDTDAPAGPEPRSRGRPGQGQSKGQGELDAITRRRLGRALRAHYADLLSAPVPERFAALIAGLDGGALEGAASAESVAEDTGQEDAR